MPVCLAMICKDESKFIREALASVKSFIDRWVIVDTGSTDGTQDIVRDEMAGIPGNLYDRPWVNWSYNRTEAINLAKDSGADFIFILDADEKVIAPADFKLVLDHDKAYWVTNHYGNTTYTRPNVLSRLHNWHYVGVTHEYLCADPDSPPVILLPLNLETNPERANKTPEKCALDASLLEKDLIIDPNNPRTVFYLAQSYKDSLQPERALETYKKRAAMGGWPEEVYISLLRVAQLSEGRKSFSEVCDAYKTAHEYRPQRAGETLRSLSNYCLWWADRTVCPDDGLFINKSCYTAVTSVMPVTPVTPLRILVIIPTQGTRSNLLKEALDSLARQTRKCDWTTIANSDEPLPRRLNDAVRKSDCQAFIVLSDDDLLEPQFIEKTAGLMEQSGADIVHTNYRHFGDENGVAGSANHISITSLCRKSMWQKTDGYVDVPCFDYDFWLSCIDQGAKVVHIPEPLWDYRIHTGQDGKTEDVAAETVLVRARHPKLFGVI